MSERAGIAQARIIAEDLQPAAVQRQLDLPVATIRFAG
jgi:hypothetical protein